MRVDMGYNAQKASVNYANFWMTDASKYYMIEKNGATPVNCGDQLPTGVPFSTKDADHDSHAGNCAIYYPGGWWFTACHGSQLNGVWGSTAYAAGPVWYGFPVDASYSSPLTFVQMAVREHDVNTPRVSSCGEYARVAPAAATGTKVVYLHGFGKVLCDFEKTDAAWTIFQRRMNGNQNFYLTYSQYAAGFGTLTENYWWGNDRTAAFTALFPSKARIDLGYQAEKGVSIYDTWQIGDASTGYLLTNTLGTCSGTCSGSISSGYKFSTHDVDQDVSGSSCAVSYQGAWWYTSCHGSNLNGVWGNPKGAYASGPCWNGFPAGTSYSNVPAITADFTQMAVAERDLE